MPQSHHSHESNNGNQYNISATVHSKACLYVRKSVYTINSNKAHPFKRLKLFLAKPLELAIVIVLSFKTNEYT